MKKIPLTKGKFAIVDDSDFERVNAFKWCSNDTRGMGKWYAIRKHKINGKYVTIGMHRFILGLTDPKITVDHINGDGLDNRRINLRVCTIQQNTKNIKMMPSNTSGYRGVSKIKDGKWRSYITQNKKRIHLGVFDTPEEVAAEYNKVAKKLNGDFASLNELKGAKNG